MKDKKLPRFKTERDEARFWATHDSVEYWSSFPEDRETLELDPELVRAIDSRAKRKQLISLRLEPRQVRLAKSVAVRQHVPYHTVLRNWIDLGMRTSLRRAR